MDKLPLILYFIDVIEKIYCFTVITIAVLVVYLFIIKCDFFELMPNNKESILKKTTKKLYIIILIAVGICIVLPSKMTLYFAATANIAKNINITPEIEKFRNLLNKKIDEELIKQTKE